MTPADGASYGPAAMAQANDLLDKYGRDFEAGAVLYQEGDEAKEVYVVHSGRVDVTTTVRGLSTVLQQAGPGAVFGENALIVGRRRAATATATEPSQILVIHGRTFEKMAQSNSEIAVRLLRKLARRLDRSHREIRTMLYRDPAARVASYLLDFGDDILPEPAALAARIGLRPGEVGALIERFTGAGLLMRDNDDRPRVHDPEELRRFLQYLDLRERFGSLDVS